MADTTVVNGRRVGLGRVQSPPDPKDFLHPMSLYLGAPRALPEFTEWQLPDQLLDQGQEPECVGFGFTHWRGNSPVRTAITTAMARAYYAEFKKRDNYPGPGTWLRVALNYFLEIGVIREYVWAQNVDQAREWVLTKGPIVIGIPWTEGMGNPTTDGRIRPTGQVLGGHCVEVNWSTMVDFGGPNSWGRWWGRDGCYTMAWADLAPFVAQSELVAAIEVGEDAPLPPPDPTDFERRLVAIEQEVAAQGGRMAAADAEIAALKKWSVNHRHTRWFSSLFGR